jgi:hypothetical protein
MTTAWERLVRVLAQIEVDTEPVGDFARSLRGLYRSEAARTLDPGVAAGEPSRANSAAT